MRRYVVAYWLSAYAVSSVGGSIEFFMLPLIIGGVLRYGWVLTRQGRPRWPRCILLSSGVAVLPSLAATNYWPHGALVPVSAGIALLAVATAAGFAVRPA